MMYIPGETQLIIIDICILGYCFAMILWTNSRIDTLQKKLRDVIEKMNQVCNGRKGNDNDD